MSIEDVALLREDSDIIQFDNIFSNDLAKEQQLDLLFGAKEDDDIIRMIESRLFDADGEEKEFAEIDEEALLMEDDEEDGGEVDISDNDADNDGTDDDMEDAPAEEPAEAEAAPKIAIDIDADNVNINADGNDSVKEDSDVNVTAQVANINPKEVPMTGADLATALSTDDDSTATPEEIPAPVTPDDNAPAPAPDQNPVNGADNVVGEDFDTTKPEPAPAVGGSDEVDFGDDPAAVEEDVQELNTASELEDVLNSGLEPAPAPEETSPVAEPEDPSTEVVFGDSNDMEEKSDIFGEEADEAVRPEDDTVIGDDNGSITQGDAPENANNGIPETEEPAHKDTSETQVGFLPKKPQELEDAMDTVEDLDIAKEAAKEPEDPNEEAVENDAETSLLGIQPTLTAGDLDKLFNTAEEDPNKDGKYSPTLNEEAGEPSMEMPGEPSKNVPVAEGECCKGCDSEPEEDQGAENIDNNIKVPEKADDLAKELGNFDNLASDAEESEKETISGEEGTHSKADEEWEDAASKEGITSDEKLDAAKNDTGYKDNRDAGDNDTTDELNEECGKCETADELEDFLSDLGDEGPDPAEGDAPTDECGASGCESCKEEVDGIEEVDKDGGNKSDDDLSSDDFATKVEDPKNDGDDDEIVDDQEQAGKDKEDGGAINTADANPTAPIATKAELEAVLGELAADSTEVIPDEVEMPKEDGEYDETVKKTKVAAPGNDGSDVEVGTYAESMADLEQMLDEDFEDQVDAISDDDAFNADINKGLDVSPEEDEPGSIEDEIDDEAIDIVEAMK